MTLQLITIYKIVMKMTLQVDEKMAEMLDVFIETGGHATTGYLVDEIGVSRPTITKRLDKLKVAECIDYVHKPTAFWRLKNDPRQENE